MAKVLLPEGMVISGSIGGTTWSRNRFGAYKRNRSMPVNPNTTRQSLVRSVFSDAATGWKTLTEEQRQGWNNYAAGTPVTDPIGQSVHLTGFQWYVATFSFMTNVENAPPSDAPTSPGLSATPALVDPVGVVANSDSEVIISPIGFVPSLTLSTYNGIAFWMNAASISAGRYFFNGPWRLLYTEVGAIATPTTVASPIPLATGDVIFVRWRSINTQNKLSGYGQARIIVEAATP